MANKSRATALLTVNRPVEYPLDLKGILPSLERTLEMTNEAEAHLAISKEQIKYAQFWFLKMTPIDDVAFNHLVAGNMSQAKEMWSKQESLSSLQNKLVCYLIENKPWLALKTAEKLYEKFGESYISKVDANCTLQMSGTELLHQFIDSLGEEVGMQKLLGYELGAETKDYISSQTVEPLISKISLEVERSKRVDHKDPNACIEAARNLVRNTKDSFAQLKQLLPANDPQFIMIADKLGLEILQCGIDYFINSDEDGRPQKAMKVLRYAQGIVAGPLAKQRCDENVNILQGIIDRLPPVSVKGYDEFISGKILAYLLLMQASDLNSIDKLNRTISFLEMCAPHLASIKEELGVTNIYYVSISTRVVDTALGNAINIVNECTDVSNRLPFGLFETTSIIELFSKAWEIMQLMRSLDMETSFKVNRFDTNYQKLSSIVSNLYIGESNSKLDLRTERQMYLDCMTVENCNYFIRVFPKSKYRQKVEEKKCELRFNACKTESECDELLKDYPQKKKEIEELREKLFFLNCKSLSKYKKYLKNYPNGRYTVQVREIIEGLVAKQLDECHTVEDYENFLQLYSDSRSTEEARKRLDAAKKKRKMQKALAFAKGVLAIAVAVGVFLFAFWYSDYVEKRAQQKAEQEEHELYDRIVSRGDTALCQSFINKYPYSNRLTVVKEILEEYEYHHVRSVDDCLEFKSSHHNSKYLPYVDSIIEVRADALRKAIIEDPEQHVNETRMQDVVNKYGMVSNPSLQALVSTIRERLATIAEERQVKEKEILERQEKQRQDSIRKEEEARKWAEYEKYGTDAKAWETAKSVNTITAYNDYLKRYPRGKHVEEANKKIIDLEVQSVISSGKYGLLPPSQKLSYGTSKRSTVKLTNNSNQTITIRYSGVKSMKIVLSPGHTRSIILPSSTYKVVATAPGVRPFYGTEDLTGGDYESVYYISTSRY